MKKQGRWEIRHSQDGQIYAVLIAPNGKVIIPVETQKRRRTVLSAIRSIRANVNAPIVELHDAQP